MSDDIISIIPAPSNMWLPALGSDDIRTQHYGDNKTRRGYRTVHHRVAYFALVEPASLSGGTRRVEPCDSEGNYLDKEVSPSRACPNRDSDDNGLWRCLGHWDWDVDDEDETSETNA